MLIERHNTHALDSFTNSSLRHSYDLNNSERIKVKKKKIKHIKNTLSKKQIYKINDILDKYNLLLDSNKNATIKSNKKHKNNEKVKIVQKFENEISKINKDEKANHNLKRRASIKNSQVKKVNSKDINFNFNSDNFIISVKNGNEQKNEDKKIYSELIIKLESGKKYFTHALSYKKIDKETRYNNINYVENKIKKKSNNDKRQKLLLYQQMNDPKNLLRKIIKPEISFMTKISKYYGLTDNMFSDLRSTIKNKFCFISKKIKGVKRFKREKYIPTEKKLFTKKNEKIKKEEEDDKFSTFSSIKTSSSNSIKNTKTKNKTKNKIKSKKNTVKQKTKLKKKNFVKMNSLFTKTRLRAISIHSRRSNNERSEEKNTGTSRKSLMPLIQNMKNKSLKPNNKLEKQALHTNKENRKYSFISGYHDRFLKQNKKEDKDIISSKSIRDINKFYSPFKNNLLNINKQLDEENNKFNNNSTIKGKDKDKINHELDFKKFLEEQNLKRKNQIRNFIKSKGMNSYNFFYPKEPSPLLGIFKNKYSVYPSLLLNRKNSTKSDKKNSQKNIKVESLHNQLLTKRSKSYLSFKQIIKENDEKHINKMHLKEKHYGNERDCPICRTFKYRIEKNDNENEMNYSKTSKYNKLKSLIKYEGIYSPKSQTNRINLSDFSLMSRNRNKKNSSQKRNIIFLNESSIIKKNFNALFDYFLQ